MNRQSGRLNTLALPVAALVTVASVAAFVLFGEPAASKPALPLQDAATLTFHSLPDGSIRVADAASGAELGHYAATGFVWGLVRSLERERRRFHVDVSAPYVLGRNEEARLTLRDPSLQRDLVFDAFGSSNRKVFEALLERGRG